MASSNPLVNSDVATRFVLLVSLFAMVAHSHSAQNQARQVELLRNNNMDERTQTKTQVPVIGVLSQVMRDYKLIAKERKFHIAGSYVKWLESSGAQVMPILLNKDEKYYEQVFERTNGLLFPGGDNLLEPSKRTPMMVAAKKLYELAVEANKRGDYYPIWGTCLGLELLSVLSSGRNELEDCRSRDVALNVHMQQNGRMFEFSHYMDISLLGPNYPDAISSIMKEANVTYNEHGKCVTVDTLKKLGLENFYRPIALSKDLDGKEFVTIFEATDYPFYAVQFHPEKPPFEFVIKRGQHNIPHSKWSIAVSRYLADFFVRETQNNTHKVDRQTVQNDLIYAHPPTYTGRLGDMYEYRYLFPYENEAGNSDEEFIDNLLVKRQVNDLDVALSESNSDESNYDDRSDIAELSSIQSDGRFADREQLFPETFAN